MVKTMLFEVPYAILHDLRVEQLVLHEMKFMDLELARSDLDKGIRGRECF